MQPDADFDRLSALTGTRFIRSVANLAVRTKAIPTIDESVTT